MFEVQTMQSINPSALKDYKGILLELINQYQAAAMPNDRIGVGFFANGPIGDRKDDDWHTSNYNTLDCVHLVTDFGMARDIVNNLYDTGNTTGVEAYNTQTNCEKSECHDDAAENTSLHNWMWLESGGVYENYRCFDCHSLGTISVGTGFAQANMLMSTYADNSI